MDREGDRGDEDVPLTSTADDTVMIWIGVTDEWLGGCMTISSSESKMREFAKSLCGG